MKTYRPLASQASSFRLYEDNYEEVMEICRTSEHKPAEEMRDLIDEALRARRAASGQPNIQSHEPETTGGNGDELARKVQQLIEQNDELKRNLQQIIEHNGAQNQTLTRELREYYGLLLEVLAGSYGARRVVWKYVAETVLRQSGYTPEQIKAQFEAEAKAWNAERDKTADTLEQAIRSLPPPQ